MSASRVSVRCHSLTVPVDNPPGESSLIESLGKDVRSKLVGWNPLARALQPTLAVSVERVALAYGHRRLQVMWPGLSDQ